MTTSPAASNSAQDLGLSIHLCAPGSRPRRLDALPAALPDDAVLWIDVPVGTVPARLLETVGTLAPALLLDDVEDLLDRDDLPKTHDKAAGFRNASFVGFTLRESEDAGTGTGDLMVQMVETLVGDRLVLSCWQHSRLFHGADSMRDEAPTMRADVVGDVFAIWEHQRCASAADLSSCLVQALLMRSRTCVAELEHSLQRWELAYHADAAETETGTLKLLLAMVNELRRRLNAFENARLMLPTDQHRFRDPVSAELERRVDELVAAGLKRCSILLESIRASMELVSMDKVARQLQMAEERSTKDEVFQGRLEKVTALLLVPTLIAGVFGANTALPGGGTWMGFDAMLVLMVVTSLAVYLYLVSRRGAADRRERPRSQDSVGSGATRGSSVTKA